MRVQYYNLPVLFSDRPCGCLKCLAGRPPSNVAQVAVSQDRFDQIITNHSFQSIDEALNISNYIFPTLEYALQVCNELARKRNLPELRRGNSQGTMYLTCTGCGKQFISFKTSETSAGYRLFSHESVEKYLSKKHICKGDESQQSQCFG